MTTTGDLFVNIKGNNRGLKQSLNQSQRALKDFAGNAEKTFNSGALKALLGGGLVAAGAWAASKNMPKWIDPGSSWRQKTVSEITLSNIMHGRGKGGPRDRAVKALEEQNRSIRRGHPGRPDLEVSRRHMQFQGNEAEHRAFLRHERRNLKMAKRIDRRAAIKQTVIRALPGILSAASTVAAVGGVVLAAAAMNGSKWQKRINESTMKYSGAVAANKARIQAANVKRDIALARNPVNQQFSMMRQNAANYRANSGNPGFGNAMNVAGAGWDYFIGFMTNALTNNPYTHGGVI